MYTRVLVTTDGSALSRAAAEHAVRLVDRADGEVCVLTVAETLPRLPGQAATLDPTVPAHQGLTEQMAAELTAGPRADAEWVRAALADAGVRHLRIELGAGSPGETIVARVRDGAFDVVVMATHGRSGLSRTLLGSVADHVVSHVRDVPILLVRPTPEQQSRLSGDTWSAAAAPAPTQTERYRHPLVGLDGSSFALRVLPSAVRAYDAETGRIDLVQAIDALPRGAADGPAGEASGADLGEREAAAAYERARAYLSSARDEAAALGARTVETRVLGGAPDDAIVDYARTHVADLVAMTTHGRAGVARAVLGSVANAVLRELAGTPLLLLHPPD